MFLLASWEPLARADEPSVTWTAPPGCPDADTFREWVRSAVPPAADEARARVAVVRSGAKWDVQVSVLAGADTFEKRFEAASCEDAARGASVVVALALGAPASADRPAEAPAPSPAAPEQSVPAPAPAPRERHWTVSAGLVADVGTLPKVALGPNLALGWRSGMWRVELGGRAHAAQRVGSAAGAADVSVLSASARVCAVARLGALETGPCAGPWVELTTAEGANVDTPAKASSLDPGALLAAFATLPVGDVIALRADAELAYAFTRPRPVVEAPNEAVAIFAPTALRVRGLAGLEARF